MTNRQKAIKIIRRLHKAGYEALLAGGCVRDMLLCRAAKDYDVATSAQPEDVIRLFKRTLKVGAKFGVVIVLLDGVQVEVATFRKETGYTDGRHPGSVEFSGASEDASRRDFTINGMFYDPAEKKVLDYVGGQKDLDKRILRTIGDPQERFSEDYLRMLRAVRFSTQLGFKIEPESFAAICANAKKITKISGERIQIEIESILTNPNRSAGMTLLIQSGLAEQLFPGMSPKQMDFAVKALGYLRKKIDFALSVATLFADCETGFAMEKCGLLKLSRGQYKHIKFLLSKRGVLLNEDMSLAQLKMLLAEPCFGDLFELQRTIQKSKVGGRRSIEKLVSLKRRIKELGDVELKPVPILNGSELMRLGIASGPTLGQLAQEMYIAQLEGILQEKEQAEQWVKKWLQRHKEIL
jgi:poly(A) polymerase